MQFVVVGAAMRRPPMPRASIGFGRAPIGLPYGYESGGLMPSPLGNVVNLVGDEGIAPTNGFVHTRRGGDALPAHAACVDMLWAGAHWAPLRI